MKQTREMSNIVKHGLHVCCVMSECAHLSLHRLARIVMAAYG